MRHDYPVVGQRTGFSCPALGLYRYRSAAQLHRAIERALARRNRRRAWRDAPAI